MHDPLGVAHEITYPWREKERLPGLGRYRRALLTIWHRDPESDGSDDSCDWFYSRVSKTELAYLENPDGDHVCSEDERWQRLIGYRIARRRLKPRPWWKHPKWHVHHWRFQLHPWQKFRNRFTRCARCGGRMGTEPRYGGWGGNEVWHGRCQNIAKMPVEAQSE